MYNLDGRTVQLERNACTASPVEVFSSNGIFTYYLRLFNRQSLHKLNKLDVYGYLIYLLNELPKLEEKPSKEQLTKLLPWSETLPEYCKIPKRA